MRSLINRVEIINNDWREKLAIRNDLEQLRNHLIELHRISNNPAHLQTQELNNIEIKIKEKLTSLHSTIPSENWALDSSLVLHT